MKKKVDKLKKEVTEILDELKILGSNLNYYKREILDFDEFTSEKTKDWTYTQIVKIRNKMIRKEIKLEDLRRVLT